MIKIRPIKNNQYDCLINYIPEPTRESAVSFKNEVISLFKTNTTKENKQTKNTKLEILLY